MSERGGKRTTSANFNPGNFLRNCATLLTLLVPMMLPSGSSSSVVYGRPALTTSASVGSSRSRTAPRVQPGGNSVGTSFRQWTMASQEPSRRQTSSSFVQRATFSEREKSEGEQERRG